MGTTLLVLLLVALVRTNERLLAQNVLAQDDSLQYVAHAMDLAVLKAARVWGNVRLAVEQVRRISELAMVVKVPNLSLAGIVSASQRLERLAHYASLAFFVSPSLRNLNKCLKANETMFRSQG